MNSAGDKMHVCWEISYDVFFSLPRSYIFSISTPSPFIIIGVLLLQHKLGNYVNGRPLREAFPSSTIGYLKTPKSKKSKFFSSYFFRRCNMVLTQIYAIKSIKITLKQTV